MIKYCHLDWKPTKRKYVCRNCAWETEKFCLHICSKPKEQP